MTPGDVDRHLSAAIASIDRHFGAGHARAHPQLVGAFLIAAATARGPLRLEDVGRVGIAVDWLEQPGDIAFTLHRWAGSFKSREIAAEMLALADLRDEADARAEKDRMSRLAKRNEP